MFDKNDKITDARLQQRFYAKHNAATFIDVMQQRNYYQLGTHIK